MRLSIRQRLTLWYSVAVVLLLCATAVGLLVGQTRLSVVRLDAELERLNATVAVVLQNELDEGLSPKAAAEDALNEVQMIGRHVAIFDRGGTVLARRWTLASSPVRDPPEEPGRVWTGTIPPSPRRAVGTRPPVPDGYVVVTAASTDELAAERADMVGALILILPGAVLVAGLSAWWVAGRALTPAANMAAEAQRITEDSTGARLTIIRRDELGRLASAFNDLLGRLETASSTRRRFLADASHELRTPVSIARTAADVALSRPDRTEAEYREALSIVADQMNQMGRMVSDMLALARTDAAEWPLTLSDFYFDELIAEVHRAVGLLADGRQVSIEATCPPDLQFRGDEGLLRQMLLNLLDNSVRHTLPGGAVRVGAASADGYLVLSVQDTGTGIPESARERIFDRFVRIDPLADAEGLGLGLAIARRIARAHGGDLTLAATGPSGTTFVVRLRAAGAPAEP